MIASVSRSRLGQTLTQSSSFHLWRSRWFGCVAESSGSWCWLPECGNPRAVLVEECVHERPDLVEVELGGGVRIEHRGVVDVLALVR